MTLALARRYRPHTFQAMVGQDVTVQALCNALDTKRLHHAYLFTGTRGVGKTSVARILAKCLNCEQGISSTPCGECSTCQAIDQGRFVDLIEVDAASRTKVEDTRELLDNVQYLPTQGRFKIYLIDEVHMLSGHSFNALLKTLEEPPEHVKFLLATTDPQKLPATVLSRCLQFHLWRVPFGKIVDQLSFVLQQENVTVEKEALQIIARAAEGSLRDALSLLEQALSFSNGKVEAAAVQAMLGLSSNDGLIALLTAIAKGDARAALQVVQSLAERVPDFSGLLMELLSLIHHLAIAQSVPEALEESLAGRAEILKLSEILLPEELQLYYQIGMHGQRDFPYAPSPKMGFEMVVLKMIAFQPVRIADFSGNELEFGDLKTSELKSTAVTEAVKRTPATLSSVGLVSPTVAAATSIVPRPSEPVKVVKPEPEYGKSSIPSALPSQIPSLQITETPTPVDWLRIINELNLTGMAKVLAEHCVVAEWHENYIHLTLDSKQKTLMSKRYEDRIKEALSLYLGKNIGLKISDGKIKGETPAVQNQRLSTEAKEATNRLIEVDPHIQKLMQTFDAKIEHVEIKE